MPAVYPESGSVWEKILLDVWENGAHSNHSNESRIGEEEMIMHWWILVRPDGFIVDGPCDMLQSQAMGFNQTRALSNLSARWEEYDPAVHGSLDSIREHIASLDAQGVL